MKYVLDARYLGPVPSGISAYVRALVDRLPALAPQESFRFWRQPLGPGRLSEAANVTQTTVPAPPNSIATLLRPSTFDRLQPDDVLHSPHNLLGRNLPCATVATVHDVMWLEHPEYCEPRPLIRPIRQALFATGIRWALRHATRVLTVSHASADAIRRAIPEVAPRLRVTHNAAAAHFRPPHDPDRTRQRAAALLGTDAPFFLVVGRNQPSKGHAVALQAFARAARPSERLVLAQRQRLRQGLDRLSAELGIDDRVHWLGASSLDDLLVLLQSATALLQPSLAEGFGLPALEAMACGCAVVASDIPPLREILGEAGHFVGPGDVADLARGLRRVADDPVLRDEMRLRGLDRARGFSWDACARDTLEAYREARAEGPRHSGLGRWLLPLSPRTDP